MEIENDGSARMQHPPGVAVLIPQAAIAVCIHRAPDGVTLVVAQADITPAIHLAPVGLIEIGTVAGRPW